MTDEQIYEAMVANVKGDLKQYEGVEYDGENEYVSAKFSKDGVTVFDATDAPFEREYTITNPAIMDERWLRSRMIATPSALKRGMNLDAMAAYLYKNLRKYIYSTLNYLIFVGGDDGENDDVEFISRQNEFLACAVEEHDLTGGGELGKNWFAASCAIVDLETITETTEEMVRDGDIFPYEKANCINDGVLTTAVHELRHVAQSNPYIPEDVFSGHGADLEEDAEAFARAVVDEAKVWVMG